MVPIMVPMVPMVRRQVGYHRAPTNNQVWSVMSSAEDRLVEALRDMVRVYVVP